MLTLIGAAVVSFAALSIVIGAGAVVTRRMWSGHRTLAFACGLAVLAAASMAAFAVASIAPSAVEAFSTAVLLLSLVVLATARPWHLVPGLAPHALLVASSAAFAFGLTFLYRSALGPFDLVRTRFYALSPLVDNVIPGRLTELLAAGASTEGIVGDWNGVDRPPLQSGMELLFRPLLRVLGAALPGPDEAVVLAFEVACQLLWIPAAYALLRALGVTRRLALPAIAITSTVSFAFFNEVFTWPKMLSAAFALAALAVLAKVLRDESVATRALAPAVVLAIAGVLAHGAAAFMAPEFVVLGLLALRRRVAGGRSFTAFGAGAGAALAVALPWFLYQHASGLPTDRLVKMHLAGVVEPTGESFLHALGGGYAALTLGDVLGRRLENLTWVFADPVGLGGGLKDWLSARPVYEWYHSTAALGVVVLPALAFTVAQLVAVIRDRRFGVGWRAPAILCALMLLCVLVWIAVLFAPDQAQVAHGSLVWLIAFATIPIAWMSSRRSWLCVALLVVQVAFTLAVYGGPRGSSAFGDVSIGALAALVAGIVGLLALVLWQLRPWTSPSAGRQGLSGTATDRTSDARDATLSRQGTSPDA